MYKDLPWISLLTEISSDSPAPGGGSVSAMAGCLGAALVCMVSQVTINKDKLSIQQKVMEDVRDKATDLMWQLNDYVDKDAEAFNQVMAAFRLPKNVEDNGFRHIAINNSFKNATMLPLTVARCCLKVMEISQQVIAKGIPNALSDAGVAVLMANAGLQGAIFNAKINLKSVSDEGYVRLVNEEIEALRLRAIEIETGAMSLIKEGLGL